MAGAGCAHAPATRESPLTSIPPGSGQDSPSKTAQGTPAALLPPRSRIGEHGGRENSTGQARTPAMHPNTQVLAALDVLAGAALPTCPARSLASPAHPQHRRQSANPIQLANRAIEKQRDLRHTQNKDRTRTPDRPKDGFTLERSNAPTTSHTRSTPICRRCT